jgi:hypothetical protein
MLSEEGFIEWSKKAKNGGLDAVSARQKWKQYHGAADAVNDTLGLNEQDAKRTLIKVKDRFILRDAAVTSQGYTMKGAEKRKAEVEDINKADQAMCRASKFHKGPSTQQGAFAEARALMNAKAAAEMSGDLSGAFGGAGRSVQAVPNVKDLVSEDEDEKEVDATAGGDDDGTMVPGAAAPGGQKSKFFVVDEAIADAVKSHKDWSKNCLLKLLDSKKELGGCLRQVTEKNSADLKEEAEMLRGRLAAIQLVVYKRKDDSALTAPEGTNLTANSIEKALEEAANGVGNDSEQPPLGELVSAPAESEVRAAEIGSEEVFTVGGPNGGSMEASEEVEADDDTKKETAAQAGIAARPKQYASPPKPSHMAGEQSGLEDLPPSTTSPGKDNKSDGGLSFIDNLLAESARCPTLAVKKYIANLNVQSVDKKGAFKGYGNVEPTRSYKSLRYFYDVASAWREYETCTTKDYRQCF